MWKDHQIYKWEHEKYWNYFEKLTEKNEFLNIDKILKTNVDVTKRQLQQRKFKKFNYLKYKTQPIKEETPAVTQANFKKSYANAAKWNTNIINAKVQHLRKQAKQTF